MSKKVDINKSLKDLEDISNWFESQKELDVEEGLKKVKDGALLIKDLKESIREVENEFEEIKKDIAK